MQHRRLLTTLLLLALLQGCASRPPAALQDVPKEGPTLSQLRSQPEAYTDVRLLWGGTIARVENLPQSTRIEIVARKLQSEGKPVEGDSSEGRFLALFDQFLDPAIYTQGRAITVVGYYSRMEERQLDQMRYRYPLLRVESHYLWPQPQRWEEEYDPYWDPYWDPFWHDPFYDPWYPFGYPYPYYPRWPHRH